MAKVNNSRRLEANIAAAFEARQIEIKQQLVQNFVAQETAEHNALQQQLARAEQAKASTIGSGEVEKEQTQESNSSTRVRSVLDPIEYSLQPQASIRYSVLTPETINVLRNVFSQHTEQVVTEAAAFLANHETLQPAIKELGGSQSFTQQFKTRYIAQMQATPDYFAATEKDLIEADKIVVQIRQSQPQPVHANTNNLQQQVSSSIEKLLPQESFVQTAKSSRPAPAPVPRSRREEEALEIQQAIAYESVRSYSSLTTVARSIFAPCIQRKTVSEDSVIGLINQVHALDAARSYAALSQAFTKFEANSSKSQAQAWATLFGFSERNYAAANPAMDPGIAALQRILGMA